MGYMILCSLQTREYTHTFLSSPWDCLLLNDVIKIQTKTMCYAYNYHSGEERGTTHVVWDITLTLACPG